ncbi:MAG: class GN sortase [Thermodesulfobacteriota bacterium]|nr:class GN sortase [Thermodesulfobacteriota bacterium]
MKSKLTLLLIVMLMVGGSLLCGSGVWIHSKALLAQVLLRQAWEETLAQGKPVKPWPWADTWPVARLHAPKYGKNLIVLAGQAGSTLAFGPGMLADGGSPGKPGTCILAGHRDTSFRFLQQVQPGDVFVLEDDNSVRWRYKVSSTIIRQAETLYLEHLPISRLALVTCYPFDAVLRGTPKRYVVLAERI